MKRTRLVAVGACSIDNILTVPHFPEEDAKLRASSFTRRRGGNTPNTLEVLRQLMDNDRTASTAQVQEEAVLELFLIVTLPARDSAQIAFIASSLNHSETIDSEATRKQSPASPSSMVDLSHCIYREDFNEPISSYIISSASTSSRTIITHNVLPEMTFDEFVHLTQGLLGQSNTPSSQITEQIWFHFEGRIPETTLKCIEYLRDHDAFKPSSDSVASESPQLMISVELEKPAREGLQNLVYGADVIFYSKAWARGQGYHDAENCLKEQARVLSSGSGVNRTRTGEKTLICPWGSQGAYALVLLPDSKASQTDQSDIVTSPAYISGDKSIVDSTGAGDTFIAGVLFGLICRRHDDSNNSGSDDLKKWSLKQTLSFANGLAGRKILQNGFHGLGELTQELKNAIDTER